MDCHFKLKLYFFCTIVCILLDFVCIFVYLYKTLSCCGMKHLFMLSKINIKYIVRALNAVLDFKYQLSLIK